jgi:hypothetical protein
MSDKKMRRVAVAAGALIALLAPVALAPAWAEAERSGFFEETAQAFWAVQHECDDGSIVEATLLVETTRDFEPPEETEDPNPTARVQYLAPCQDGSQVRWLGIVPATITGSASLQSLTASGEGLARDAFSSALIPVSFNVTWTTEGGLMTDIRSSISEGFRITITTQKSRDGTATGQVIADGVTLVDGEANPPAGRPAPFIRTDEERIVRMP